MTTARSSSSPTTPRRCGCRTATRPSTSRSTSHEDKLDAYLERTAQLRLALPRQRGNRRLRRQGGRHQPRAPDHGRRALHRRPVGGQVPQDLHLPAAHAPRARARWRPPWRRSRTPSSSRATPARPRCGWRPRADRDDQLPARWAARRRGRRERRDRCRHRAGVRLGRRSHAHARRTSTGGAGGRRRRSHGGSEPTSGSPRATSPTKRRVDADVRRDRRARRARVRRGRQRSAGARRGRARHGRPAVGAERPRRAPLHARGRSPDAGGRRRDRARVLADGSRRRSSEERLLRDQARRGGPHPRARGRAGAARRARRRRSRRRSSPPR